MKFIGISVRVSLLILLLGISSTLMAQTMGSKQTIVDYFEAYCSWKRPQMDQLDYNESLTNRLLQATPEGSRVTTTSETVVDTKNGYLKYRTIGADPDSYLEVCYWRMTASTQVILGVNLVSIFSSEAFQSQPEFFLIDCKSLAIAPFQPLPEEEWNTLNLNTESINSYFVLPQQGKHILAITAGQNEDGERVESEVTLYFTGEGFTSTPL